MHKTLEFTSMLQLQAAHFLRNYVLKVGNVLIYPKEIEVYYYQTNLFEDYTVHRNEMQLNRKGYFYIHRYGQKANDSYIKKPRGGCDLVLSDSDDIFYSLLIRSVKIDDKLYIGPRNSLNAILKETGLDEKKLENEKVILKKRKTNEEIKSNKAERKVGQKTNFKDYVITSPRIGLGDSNLPKNIYFKYLELRFILCDIDFLSKGETGIGYKLRTNAIDTFLKHAVFSGMMTLDEAREYSKDKYQAVPKWIKGYQTETIHKVIWDT